MKIYAVVALIGENEIEGFKVMGVFDTLELAESCKMNLLAYTYRCKAEKPPYSHYDFYTDHLNEEERAEFVAWTKRVKDAKRLNVPDIKEVELNTLENFLI